VCGAEPDELRLLDPAHRVREREGATVRATVEHRADREQICVAARVDDVVLLPPREVVADGRADGRELLEGNA
jgi:hypothetical protein